MSDPKPKSNWALLYDMESRGREVRVPNQGPGRPANRVKRHPVSVSMTDEEKRLYEKLNYLLVDRLHPNKVFKSQVLGLALRLLNAYLSDLPQRVSSWEEVAEQLQILEEGDNDA